MAILEAKRICDQLKNLMEAQVRVENLKTTSKGSYAQRLERELELLPKIKCEADLLTAQLIMFYKDDPDNLRPLLTRHVIMIIGCINAQDNLYGTRYREAKKNGLGDSSFYKLHIEKLNFFRENKELLCLLIFSSKDQLQLISTLSPKIALSQLMPDAKILLVELGPLPEKDKRSAKERFQLLLDSGFFEFKNIRFAAKMDQLGKAAAIVGCSVRYLQELVEDLKIEGKDPFPRLTDNIVDI